MRVFVLLFLFSTTRFLTAMPYMFTSEPDIDITPAGHQLMDMFEHFLQNQPERCRNALDFGIRSTYDQVGPRISKPQRYRDDHLAHLQNCDDMEEHRERGFRGIYIFQSLLADHLNLLMSISLEKQLIVALMYMVYLKDVESFAESPTDDELPRRLFNHAKERDYSTWQEYLQWIE